MRQLFGQTAEKILADNLGLDSSMRRDEGSWSERLWTIMIQSGLTQALVCEENGGAGASFAEVFPIIFATGKFAAPIPLIENMIANYFLDIYGLKISSGITTFSQDVLELSDGIVSGTLHGVPWGIKADNIVCIARHGNSLHLTLLPSADAENTKAGLNIAQNPRDDLEFIGSTPISFAPLKVGHDKSTLLRAGALMRSAQIAGALETITNMSTLYASEREQFGRPISKFQAIQQMMAQLAEKAVLAYTSTDCAFHHPVFNPSSIDIAAAKLVANDSASEGAALAHSVHGAIGFTHEYHLHYYSRSLWSWRAEFGTTTFWADTIGHQACNRGSTAIWPSITQGRWP